MTGKRHHEKGLVPTLRFPEFRDAGAWTRRTLGTYLLEHTGRVPAKTDIPVYTSSRSGLTPQGEYFDGSNLQNFGEYNVVPNGYVTYRHMSDDGLFKFNQNQTGDPIAVSKEYPVFTTFGISLPFLLNILNNGWDFKRFALSQKKGGTRTRLYLSVLKTWDPLLPPSEAEQEKIADCMSSLDALIAAERDRLTVLKAHKNGLMQKLFPVKGETIPRLRLPEFQGAGEWEERKLRSLLKCPPAYGANAPAVPYDADLPTYLRITDISEEGRYIREAKVSVAVRPNSENSMLHDDIALVRTGASVGKSYLHNESQGPLVFAGFLIRIRTDSRLVLPQFVYQFLQTEIYWSWVAKTSARSGQPGINSTEYSSLAIPLPPASVGCELAEQQGIADCLSSLDVLMSALTDKIKAIKLYKMALMQQILPSPHEASA